MNAIDALMTDTQQYLFIKKNIEGIRYYAFCSRNIVERVAPLSQKVKSFYLFDAHEFLLAMHSPTHLQQYPDVLSQHHTFTEWLFMQLFCKQNMTINDAVPVYHQLEEIVQYSPAQFVRYIENNKSVNPLTR